MTANILYPFTLMSLSIIYIFNFICIIISFNSPLFQYPGFSILGVLSVLLYSLVLIICVIKRDLFFFFLPFIILAFPNVINDFLPSFMMGPVMDNFLNHYMFPFAFPSLVRGQNTWDLFTLDFRNTQSPYIGDGWIDFFLSGELMYAGQGCELAADNLQFSVAGSTMS